jgi:hypothetical protein
VDAQYRIAARPSREGSATEARPAAVIAARPSLSAAASRQPSPAAVPVTPAGSSRKDSPLMRLVRPDIQPRQQSASRQREDYASPSYAHIGRQPPMNRAFDGPDRGTCTYDFRFAARDARGNVSPRTRGCPAMLAPRRPVLASNRSKNVSDALWWG